MILGVSVIVLLLGVSVAFAGSFSTAAEKWFEKNCVIDKHAPKGIEAAVCDLRGRVLALEAKAPVPGPQGIQGIKGDKGDTGSQGLTGNQGLKGDKGDTGGQGVQGPAGTVGGTNIISNSVTGASFDTVTAEATCPSGTILLSGGAKVTAGIASRAFVSASYPINISTWRAIATTLDQGANFVTITTYAICSQ